MEKETGLDLSMSIIFTAQNFLFRHKWTNVCCLHKKKQKKILKLFFSFDTSWSNYWSLLWRSFVGRPNKNLLWGGADQMCHWSRVSARSVHRVAPSNCLQPPILLVTVIVGRAFHVGSWKTTYLLLTPMYWLYEVFELF